MHFGVRRLQLRARVTARLGRLLLTFCVVYAALLFLGPARPVSRRDAI
jgi:hypothetical protein